MTPFITTYTGKHVNPLDPRWEDICIEDIAHALALCNRFAGHTKRPMSVAQHSVWVSRLCDRDPKVRLQGLLHDASEAYLGDVTKWLKESRQMAGYRAAEDHVQRIIYLCFGCDVDNHPSVEEADRLMVRVESFKLITGGQESPLFNNPRYPRPSKAELRRVGPLPAWGWKTAEEVFLAEYRSIQMEIHATPDLTSESVLT